MHVQSPKLRLAWMSVGLILLFSSLTSASPTIEFSYGFDGQVMRHRFMPLRVTVSGLLEPVEGTIAVHQIRGTAGETHFPVMHTIYAGTIENRTYRVTLPNIEPLNPISIELLDCQSGVLASSEHVPRSGVREWPFPVIVEDRMLVGRTEPIVDPSELPTDWWAYDAVESVWLLTPILSTPVLEALGEWVVSGGSLVLFTGAEFPRMDSPVFRKLLPVTMPVLTETADGIYLLEGRLRDRASSRIVRDGSPILINMPLGAGRVALVTARFEDLSEDEIEQIFGEIHSAVRMPNIEQVLHEAIRSTPVPRPPFWIAGVLLVVTLAGLIVFCEARYHLESLSRLRAFIGIFAALCVLILSATTWAGLYARRYNDRVDVYQTNTTIRVQSSFGLDITLSTLFAAKMVDISVEHPVASYPLPPIAPTIRNVDFSEDNTDSQSCFALQEGERRDLTILDQGRLDVTMSLTPAGAEITNRTESELLEAYILLGDMTYCIPVIQAGKMMYDLSECHLPGERSALPIALLNWFPMRKGAVPWLLLMNQNDERIFADFKDEGIYKQVRKVTITIIEGESQ